jgi:hypothetical protein
MLLMPEGLAGVVRRFAAGWPRRSEERAATAAQPGTVEDASVSGHGTA